MTHHERKGGDGHDGPHVLLVEDSPADAELTQIAVRQDRPEVNMHAAATADEALAFLRQQGECGDAPRPDLILLDLNLPGRDGTEIAAIIKADDALRSIPIIMFSNSNSDLDVRSAYESGANAYLVKPMEYADIREAMSVLLAFWLRWACLPAGPPDPVVAATAADEATRSGERRRILDQNLISPFSPVAADTAVAPLSASGPTSRT